METNATKPARSPRVILLIAGALVAIVAVVYFSFFYPPVDSQDTQGTIGAAKKWRSEQITDKDVKLEGVEASTSATALADMGSATALKNTAADLANAANGLARKPGFDNKLVVDLNKTAEQLNNMASNVLSNKLGYSLGAFQQVLNSAAALKNQAEAALASKEKIGNTEVLAMQASIAGLGEKAELAQREAFGMKELGLKEIGNKEIGNKPIGNKEIGNKEVGNKPIGNKEIGNKEVGNKPVGNKEIGNKEVGNKEVGNKEIGNKEIGAKPNLDSKPSSGQ